jgi:hypothetical protein
MAGSLDESSSSLDSAMDESTETENVSYVRTVINSLKTAAAERVFSLLQNSFTQRQSSSLEDYIETSIMLQYNIES